MNRKYASKISASNKKFYEKSNLSEGGAPRIFINYSEKNTF